MRLDEPRSLEPFAAVAAPHAAMPPPLKDLLEQSALDSQERRLDGGRVREALAEHYGFAGVLRRVATEKDDTFVLTPEPALILPSAPTIARGTESALSKPPVSAAATKPGAQRFLVKVSSSYEDPRLVDLQSAVLEHVAQVNLALPVPRLVRTVSGASGVACFEGPGPYPRVLRVLSYLEGRPLGAGPVSGLQRLETGRMLGNLSTALASFDHPSASRLLVWDLQNFPDLEPLLEYVDVPELRALILQQFENYAAEIAPRLPEVRYQVLHNDFNRYNLLVNTGADAGADGGAAEGKLCGVIDFGDVVRTAVPFDLAIAASGHLAATGADPWSGVREVVRGYQQVRPLAEVELSVAVWASPVRIALRSLLIHFQSAISPQRGDYLKSHATGDLEILRAVAQSSTDEQIHALMTGVCE